MNEPVSGRIRIEFFSAVNNEPLENQPAFFAHAVPREGELIQYRHSTLRSTNTHTYAVRRVVHDFCWTPSSDSYAQSAALYVDEVVGEDMTPELFDRLFPPVRFHR